MATAPFHVFAKDLLALGSKLENVSSDSLKCMLLGSTSPSSVLATAEFVSDVTAVSAEIAAGNGYSAGGAAVPSVTWAATAANSWATTWAASTAHNVGDIVRPSTGNGYLYQAVVAGTSAASAPSFPTVVGTTVTDGGVTWLCVGTAVTVLGGANVVYTSSGGSITANYGLVYDSTPGSAAANPVIGYYDFGGALTASGGGTLTVTVPSSGILALPSS